MGGHGGINILFDKKWNVYNRDNIRRFRDDEEKKQNELQNNEENLIKQKLKLKYLQINKNMKSFQTNDNLNWNFCEEIRESEMEANHKNEKIVEKPFYQKRVKKIMKKKISIIKKNKINLNLKK